MEEEEEEVHEEVPRGKRRRMIDTDEPTEEDHDGVRVHPPPYHTTIPPKGPGWMNPTPHAQEEEEEPLVLEEATRRAPVGWRCIVPAADSQLPQARYGHTLTRTLTDSPHHEQRGMMMMMAGMCVSGVQAFVRDGRPCAPSSSSA